jgi:hypothetical protein
MSLDNTLSEVDVSTFQRSFPSDPHPFICEAFVNLNSTKADKVIRLVYHQDKPVLGLVAGIQKGIIKSPFSAPFGGLHFKNNNIYISEIEGFLNSLQNYIKTNHLRGMEIVLPPNIYHESFNAKLSNALIRAGFQTSIPEITNWISLKPYTGEFSQKNSREYYRQAVRNELSFMITDEVKEKRQVFDLIVNNRAKFGRPIHMTYENVIQTSSLWPTDFFKVISRDNKLVASAIFYRFHASICYAVFWGDNEFGRALRAMDFLAFQLWNHYKHAGYSYIDLGISTENGKPNEGLLRFKESHDATSSLRFKYSWYI